MVLLPLYVAVILCEPTVRFDMVTLAAPVEIIWIFDEPDQEVPQSMNVTVSPAMPDELLTIAVNFTFWPYTDGFSEDDTVVLVEFFVVVTVGKVTVFESKVTAPEQCSALPFNVAPVCSTIGFVAVGPPRIVPLKPDVVPSVVMPATCQ